MKFHSKFGSEQLNELSGQILRKIPSPELRQRDLGGIPFPLTSAEVAIAILFGCHFNFNFSEVTWL